MVRDILVYSKDYTTQYLKEKLYAGDRGYRIVLNCAIDVSDCTCSVSVMRADKGIITAEGECEGKVAYCVLPQSATMIKGRWKARVTVSDGEHIVTVADIAGAVEAQWDDSAVTEDDKYPILTTLISQVEALQEEYKSAISEVQGLAAVMTLSVESFSELDELEEKYVGMRVYVIEDEKDYLYTGEEWIDTSFLSDGSVTTSKIADDAVTGDKVADGAIGTEHLKDGSVTNAKIANLVGTDTKTGSAWGYIPYVMTDGGIELGLYADFHMTSADGIDRYARIRIYDDDGTPRFKLEGSSANSTANLTVKNLTAEQCHGTYFGTLGYPLTVTLNGTAYTYNANSANATTCANGLVFFAPTAAGTEGYLLLADENGVPAWADTLPYSTKFKTGSGTSAASVSLSAVYSLVTTLANTVTSQASTISSQAKTITALQEAVDALTEQLGGITFAIDDDGNLTATKEDNTEEDEE